MSESTLLPFALPSIGRKKVTAAFDGGRLSSDGGVVLLAQAERRVGVADRLAAALSDPRNPALITHTHADIMRARMLAIASGYEDGNDLAHLRADPAFKLACGRLPDTGADLCSQPTVSRLENMASRSEIRALLGATVDLYCASYAKPPKAVTLDIDDTVDETHGAQQLSFFNAYEDAYCFKPIHVYDVATGAPVLALLRPGKTPDGREVRAVLYLSIERIRTHWPNTRIAIRGDSHYGRAEVLEWCEKSGVSYVFGLAGNAVLAAKTESCAAKTAKALARAIKRNKRKRVAKKRAFAEFRYATKSWDKQRRVVARIEASSLGVDVRYVVTNLKGPAPQHIYETLYCARGQAENLIKLHKTQLKSDRTSCHSALANQMRLVLHTGAYWLLLLVRNAIPKAHALARAEFATLRLHLVKIGVRIAETATRVRAAFCASCPHAPLFTVVLAALGCDSS